MSAIETRIRTASRDLVARFRVHSSEAAPSILVFAGAGIVERAVVVNATATGGYLQVHDAAALPDNDAVPVLSIVIPASGAVVIEDVYCATGAVLAISTTAATLTISTNNSAFFANYRR